MATEPKALASSSTNGTHRTPSIAVHVEVRLRPISTASDDQVRSETLTFLTSNLINVQGETELTDWTASPFLHANVDRIRIAEIASPSSSSTAASVAITNVSLQIHVYQPSSTDIVDEFSAADPTSDDADETTAASVSELPNRSLDGVWDSLVYEDSIKPKLLNYIYTTLLFSDANVNFNLVSWNRVVLLHGPPGTGKTSLCKALAQKLSIRLSSRYTHGKLVEINSHSLFSKWFSESGKLVQRLFTMITEMVEDEDAFVVVLIDEVESLTADRSAANGSEPTDSVRVVNALLTQLDRLKHRRNVLIMTTSNLTSSIDTAFMDRADIRQYVGLPPAKAIYWILKSCLEELMRVGLVEEVELPEYDDKMEGGEGIGIGIKLAELAESCQGLSGRSLRRLPVLAHAHYIGSGQGKVSCEVWLEAIKMALADIRNEA